MFNKNELKDKKLQFLSASTLIIYIARNGKYLDKNYLFSLFLFMLLYIFTINPFLEKKLNIRKLANYHDGRERAFSTIITLPIFALIIYSIELTYNYFWK